MKQPKLRFKEFYGEWNKVHLNEITDRIVRKNKGLSSTLPLTISAEYGLVDQITYFKKSVASKNLEGYYLLKEGEFAYNKSYSNGYPLGAIKRLNKYKEGVLSTLYICFKAKPTISGNFLESYFDTSKWNKEVAMISVEGARNHGLLNVGIEDFFNTSHYIPNNNNEQNKIADFFTLLDQRIEKQQEKVEAWREYKKGMMQKLFSRELRFKDENGEEFPEWEEVKIKDVFKITRGNVLATGELNENGLYPVYSSQTKNKGLMGYYNEYLYENAITWTTDGANAGNTNYRSGKFYCTNVCGVLISDEGYANYCISEMLNLITHRHVSYVGNPKLMNNVMGEIKLQVPTVKEQQKISNYILLMNDKIEQEANKLEVLEKQKRGYMQRMFI